MRLAGSSQPTSPLQRIGLAEMKPILASWTLMLAVSFARETRYNTMITTFHPEGRLLQLEHAQAAADRGLPVLAITLPNSAGVLVLTSMGSVRPKLLELNVPAGLKFAKLDSKGRLGLAFSGVAVDGVALVKAGREFVADEVMAGNDHPTPMDVALYLAEKAHEATIAVSQRPLGASVLIVGTHRDRQRLDPELVSVQPSGLVERWRACALGAGARRVMAFLDEHSGDLLTEAPNGAALRRFAAVCAEAFRQAGDLPGAVEVHLVRSEIDGQDVHEIVDTGAADRQRDGGADAGGGAGDLEAAIHRLLLASQA